MLTTMLARYRRALTELAQELAPPPIGPRPDWNPPVSLTDRARTQERIRAARDQHGILADQLEAAGAPPLTRPETYIPTSRYQHRHITRQHHKQVRRSNGPPRLHHRRTSSRQTISRRPSPPQPTQHLPTHTNGRKHNPPIERITQPGPPPPKAGPAGQAHPPGGPGRPSPPPAPAPAYRQTIPKNKPTNPAA